MIVRVTKQSTGGSLPIGYTISGELKGFVIPGRPLTVDRRERNGMQVRGWFQTSNVQESIPTARGLLLRTENGVYLLQELDEATKS